MPDRTEIQEPHYRGWLATVGGNRLAVVELGAGTAIPTVRHQCELRSRRLIRINPREPTLCRTVS
ncbi:MAG: hypothetical protein ACLQNE_16015 [Thermoguttaceae bacterium]